MKNRQMMYFSIGSIMFLIAFIYVWNVWRNPDFPAMANSPVMYVILAAYLTVMIYFFVKAFRS
mgnify:CR=1 FL=1